MPRSSAPEPGPSNGSGTSSTNPTSADGKPAGGSTGRAPYIVQEKGAPGLRGMETTSIFRVVNFELFAKPNFVTMAVGVVSITACVAYIAYWNATAANRKNTYTSMDEDGKFKTRKKVSRWD